MASFVPISIKVLHKFKLLSETGTVNNIHRDRCECVFNVLSKLFCKYFANIL